MYFIITLITFLKLHQLEMALKLLSNEPLADEPLANEPLANEHLHCVFVYCDRHDQGAVAIITHTEWLNITANSHLYNYNENYYEKIFKYVITMCGNELPECKWTWRCCGNLEYNPQGELLIGKESVQTNFDREYSGLEFKYFQYELFTSNEHIECHILPRMVKEYLSHPDVPVPVPVSVPVSVPVLEPVIRAP